MPWKAANGGRCSKDRDERRQERIEPDVDTVNQATKKRADLRAFLKKAMT
jgi:hypothetical protein